MPEMVPEAQKDGPGFPHTSRSVPREDSTPQPRSGGTGKPGTAVPGKCLGKIESRQGRYSAVTQTPEGQSVLGMFFRDEGYSIRSRLRPVFPLQALDPAELPDVRSHERQLVPQGLTGDQHIVRSNRFADGLQTRAHTARNLGILEIERQQTHRSSQEGLYQLRIGFPARTLPNSIPEFKSDDRRNQHRGVGSNRLLKAHSYRRS